MVVCQHGWPGREAALAEADLGAGARSGVGAGCVRGNAVSATVQSSPVPTG